MVQANTAHQGKGPLRRAFLFAQMFPRLRVIPRWKAFWKVGAGGSISEKLCSVGAGQRYGGILRSRLKGSRNGRFRRWCRGEQTQRTAKCCILAHRAKFSDIRSLEKPCDSVEKQPGKGETPPREDSSAFDRPTLGIEDAYSDSEALPSPNRWRQISRAPQDVSCPMSDAQRGSVSRSNPTSF